MADAQEIRIQRTRGKPIELDVGGAANLVVTPRTLPVLEFGDINFGVDRAVMIPPLSGQERERAFGKPRERASGKPPEGDAQPAEPPHREFRALSEDAVLERAFLLLQQDPHKLLCVAGHTDQSGTPAHNDQLSEDRALSVALYLKAGARAAWAKHAFKNAKADDYQQVLTWVHLTRGYFCNPRAIDNDFGKKSQQALKNFKVAFNADFGGAGGAAGADSKTKLTVDGTRREEDWLAFYDLYDAELSQVLGISREELAVQRNLVVFTDPAVLGCGSRFPLGDPKDPTKPAPLYAPHDRRVDILFLDATELPDLKKQPPGQAVYGEGAFVLEGIPVTPKAEPPRPAVVEVLEISDGNWDTGRSVLLPSTVPGIDAPGITSTHTFRKLFDLLDAADGNKLLCIAGHTDTQGSEQENDQLSRDRAENVLFYLVGNADEWARLSFANAKDDDWQRILQWISMVQNLPDVDPGGVDGSFGSKSKAALKAFRKHFNGKLGFEAGFAVEEDAERFEGDFHAFFFMYDLALQAELEVDLAGLAQKRSTLVFTPLAAIGSGEHFTVEAIGEDNHPSGRNRRVDILMFDPEEVLDLTPLPAGLLVYGLGRVELQYVNQKIRLPVLDLADTHFRTGRSVLVPAPAALAAVEAAAEKGGTKQDGASTNADDAAPPSFERGFADLFKVLERFPKKQVLVAGHTDSIDTAEKNDALSADRAESVLFYVSGKKEAFVEHAQKHAAAEDYQQALTWVNEKRPGFACDPGGIDNNFGGGSKRALIAFKKAYNKAFGKKLPEDDTRRKDDWGAFYDVYDDVVSSDLGLPGPFTERQKALDDRRKQISFADPAAIGCGEHFTVEKAGEDGVPSLRNRRVDVILFDQGELPPLKTQPPGQEIYGVGRFVLVPVGDIGLAFSIRLQDVAGPDGVPLSFAPFQLLDGDNVLEAGEADQDGRIEFRTHITAASKLTLRYPGRELLLTAPELADVASVLGRKQRLAFLGYNTGPLDEEDSVVARGALAEFQRDHALPVTGKPDRGTNAKLDSLTQSQPIKTR